MVFRSGSVESARIRDFFLPSDPLKVEVTVEGSVGGSFELVSYICRPGLAKPFSGNKPSTSFGSQPVWQAYSCRSSRPICASQNCTRLRCAEAHNCGIFAPAF